MTRDDWIALLEPTIVAMGYDLVEVVARPHADHGLLRVYIDHLTKGDEAQLVQVEDCEKVSHQISGLLDVEDPMPGQYRLEVSSPGLDRPLRTPQHYAQAVGEQIKIKFHRASEACGGRSKTRGKIIAADDDQIELQLVDKIADEGRVTLSLNDIASARVVPEF